METILNIYPIRIILFKHLSPLEFGNLIKSTYIPYDIKYDLYTDYIIQIIKTIFLVDKEYISSLLKNVKKSIELTEELISVTCENVSLNIKLNHIKRNDDSMITECSDIIKDDCMITGCNDIKNNLKEFNEVIKMYDEYLQLELEYTFLLKNIDTLYKIKDKPYLIHDYNLYRLLKIIKIYSKLILI